LRLRRSRRRPLPEDFHHTAKDLTLALALKGKWAADRPSGGLRLSQGRYTMKCRHSECWCQVEAGRSYCSEECEQLHQLRAHHEPCSCAHAACV
jgi:hypothetical protein